ncbi:MAG TPA: endo alpha-1,4 polygalactosaminidase [Hyphomicrobiales bacterium]
MLATAAAGLAISAGGLGALLVKAMQVKTLRWVVFYGQTADEATLAAYDIVILDPGFTGSIEAVARSGAQLFGYLSLGEIRTTSPFFGRVHADAVLDESLFSPGTRKIDIRHPSWQSLVLDHLVPEIQAQGFAGLMLDTLDTPPHLEQVDGERYAGMRQAAIDLVRTIRSRWPEMKLIMNRGYALLPELADILDAIIAESLLTRPNPANGNSMWTSEREVAQQLALLTPVKRWWWAPPILSLDYWAPEDTATIEQIYRRERKLGHHPYVATPLLDRIVPEPPSGQEIDGTRS